MRWPVYFIFAYVMLGLQVGLAGHVSIGGARPNLGLIAVVFIALNAPYDAALLGGFGLGTLQDLTTQQPLGIFALAYSLAAMFVISTQQVVYRGHPLTHFSLTLVGSLITAIVMLAHAWLRGPEKIPPVPLFYSTLYTAIVGVIVLGGLNQSRRIFAFVTPRRRIFNRI